MDAQVRDGAIPHAWRLHVSQRAAAYWFACVRTLVVRSPVLVIQSQCDHPEDERDRPCRRALSYSREQLARVLDLLATDSDIAIAKQVGLDRLAIHRIRQDPAKAEAALASWEALNARPRRGKGGMTTMLAEIVRWS